MQTIKNKRIKEHIHSTKRLTQHSTGLLLPSSTRLYGPGARRKEAWGVLHLQNRANYQHAAAGRGEASKKTSISHTHSWAARRTGGSAAERRKRTQRRPWGPSALHRPVRQAQPPVPRSPVSSERPTPRPRPPTTARPAQAHSQPAAPRPTRYQSLRGAASPALRERSRKGRGLGRKGRAAGGGASRGGVESAGGPPGGRGVDVPPLWAARSSALSLIWRINFHYPIPGAMRGHRLLSFCRYLGAEADPTTSWGVVEWWCLPWDPTSRLNHPRSLSTSSQHRAPNPAQPRCPLLDMLHISKVGIFHLNKWTTWIETWMVVVGYATVLEIQLKSVKSVVNKHPFYKRNTGKSLAVPLFWGSVLLAAPCLHAGYVSIFSPFF